MRKKKVSVSFHHLDMLSRAAFRRDLRAAKRGVESIAWEIAAKHPEESQQLRGLQLQQMMEVPKTSTGSGKVLPLVALRTPDVRGVLPRLSAHIEKDIEDFFLETEMRIELADVGETPRRSFIFVGPPGVGKTITARWIARRLGFPIVEINLASSVGQFLGATGNNVKQVFDYAKVQPCVLFMDEFDALVRQRGKDVSHGGEMDRVVNVLLKEIEEWPDEGVLIAATNMPNIIDDAIWRRFDTRIDFELPAEAAVRLIVEDTAEPLEMNEEDLGAVVAFLSGKNGGEIVKQVKKAKRNLVLHKKGRGSEDLAKEIIEL
jgi:SpoVK/Ycf46/Vps4 family AAA+-type ATPase